MLDYNLFVPESTSAHQRAIHHLPTGDLIVKLSFPPTLPPSECKALAHAFACTPTLLEAIGRHLVARTVYESLDAPGGKKFDELVFSRDQLLNEFRKAGGVLPKPKHRKR